MEFSKLNAPTLKELFIKELEAMILSGRLEVGQRLPPERELAEKMHVSRAVVNSGISELARKGFLCVKPRAGVYVVDYRRFGTVDTLLSIMNYNGGHLRRDEIRSILELKIIIDKLAAELAVQKLTDADVAALKNRLNSMKQAEGQIQEGAEATFEFYHELAMISGNTLLPLIYRSFRVPVVHLWGRFLRKYGSQVALASASSLYIAIQSRNKEAAIAAAEAAVSASIAGGREIYED